MHNAEHPFKIYFHLRLDDLERSSHPVMWLRIKLLADRARASGYVSTGAIKSDGQCLVA